MAAIEAELLSRVAAHMAVAQRVVVLTGAGVSAESGIATFRDAQKGYWSKFDPEVLASPEGFARDPGLVWRWYMERHTNLLNSLPNRAHVALAELERHLPHLTLATQNVDDLHERAGSKRVLHLHGSLTHFRCSVCRRPYHLRAEDHRATLPPPCSVCGQKVRPGVVWFGEMLPQGLLHETWEASRACNLFLVVGTSGVVMPAAGLPELARDNGATVVEINPERSEITRRATFYLQGRAGEVLPALLEAMADTQP